MPTCPMPACPIPTCPMPTCPMPTSPCPPVSRPDRAASGCPVPPGHAATAQPNRPKPCRHCQMWRVFKAAGGPSAGT
ncbi:hypothetical protein HaLaN_06569 [Haematococcus lacustris]|uniref:Uncharacterized protein n=1 Tax=Haematococcus lacustris TaxID=44745 RepID=A0A699YVQ8_HAELA|nr:hypothetical protein HaLaN_06569 [Haematococcus lacustris]